MRLAPPWQWTTMVRPSARNVSIVATASSTTAADVEVVVPVLVDEVHLAAHRMVGEAFADPDKRDDGPVGGDVAAAPRSAA